MPPAIEVRVQQRFPASAEAVFDAWLDPAWLERWMFGPQVREETLVHLRLDPRVGGAFSFLVERQGQRLDHIGVYRVIDRPRELSFSWALRGESDEEASEVHVTLQPENEACLLTLVHRIPARWADYAERTRQGWTTMLGNLQRVL